MDRCWFFIFLWRTSFICLQQNITTTKLIMKSNIILHGWHTLQVPKHFHRYYFNRSHLVTTKPWGVHRVSLLWFWVCTWACYYYYVHCAQRNLRLRGVWWVTMTTGICQTCLTKRKLLAKLSSLKLLTSYYTWKRMFPLVYVLLKSKHALGNTQHLVSPSFPFSPCIASCSLLRH